MAATLTPSEIEQYHESKQHAIVGSLTIFLILGNSFVAAKLYTQFRSSKKPLVEDIFLVVALASADAVCASYLQATHYGLGLHINRVVAEDPDLPHRLMKLYYWIWLPAVFNAPVFGGVKFCLLFLYRRLFLVNQKWLRIAWHANVVYLIAWSFGSFFFYLFACSPPSYYWNRLYVQFQKLPPHPVRGTCVRTTVAEGVLTLIFAVIQDFALLLLPIITLAELQMSRKRKMGLMLLFSLGLIACILEVARIIDLSIKSGTHGWSKLVDPSYDLANFVIMTCAVEMIAIMCACFPVVAPQALHCYESLKSAWTSTQGSSALRRLIDRGSRKQSASSGESASNLAGEAHELGTVNRGGYYNLEESDKITVTTDIDVHPSPQTSKTQQRGT